MFYYGHPRNRFWKVLAGVFGEPEPHTIDEKRALALRNKIALWDVLAQCEIKGAADESITNPVCNDFSKLLAETYITKIYTNGAQAYKLYTKYCLAKTGIDAVPLPSTSPANAQCSLQDLIVRYAVIR
ncbi:hypothetical protein AGMMS50212_10830 [Spirochaetia bacterium]|nr:hypothetical protein AGMMS50212_10830 [Spirochaetia bacterium]